MMCVLAHINERVEDPANSDLHAMPDDDIMLISRFEAVDSNDKGTKFTTSKVYLTQSEEATADNILDEMADLKASADKQSDPLETVETIMPDIINKPLNKELNALNTLEIQRFENLQKELLSAIHKKVGKSVRKCILEEMDIVKDRLSYFGSMLDKGDVNIRELVNLVKDMVSLLDSALVFRKANAEGEKWEKTNLEPQITDPTQGDVQKEQPSGQEPKKSEQTPPIAEQVLPELTTLVVHALEEKVSEEEPPSKRLKFLIPNPIISSPNPLKSILPQNITLEQFTDSLFHTTSSRYSPTPPRDENKGKGIATKENPMEDLIPLMDEG
ncbi:hypothetical protein Tco_0379332 [Tanacetum coccineum]